MVAAETTAPGPVAESAEPAALLALPDRAPVLGRVPRLVLAVVVALVVGAALVARLGLVGGDAIGIADNADGARLFCAAELAPLTTDGRASGHGITVTEFRTGGPACRIPAPLTSAGLVLDAAVAVAPILDRTPASPDGTTRFSLEWLGALYAGLFALGAGVAAWAATAGRRARGVGPALLAVVGAPLLPLLVVPWWSRFLVSTYGEPAGLLGAAWMAWGLMAVAVTRPADRAARTTALVLVAVGGLTAATAKPGYLAVGLVAAAACALVAVGTARWWRRLPGLVAALLVVAVGVVPVVSALRSQDALYEVVNAHDLVFTAVLPESGPAAVPALGLRPGAWGHAGEHYYLEGGRSVPGWTETVAARPAELRAQAHAWLVAHPRVFARMVHRGLIATLRPQVPYMPSTTAGARVVSGDIAAPAYPESSQVMGPTFVYLDGLPARWAPPAVLGAAVLLAALTLVPLRRLPRRATALRAAALRASATPAVGLVRAAGVLAVAALAVVVVAVVGDGYVELTKHVWLGSYPLLVGGTALVGGLAVAGAALVGPPSRRGHRMDDAASGRRE